MGHICPTDFQHFLTFSPRLETNNALQCSSDSFPQMVIYILCVENCQNSISAHSCLPMAGRLFFNVRKFHAPRISECNLRGEVSRERIFYQWGNPVWFIVTAERGLPHYSFLSFRISTHKFRLKKTLLKQWEDA